MTLKNGNMSLQNLPEEIHKRKRVIIGELRERTLWFIRLRWWVPPSLVAGATVARMVGVEFSAGALVLVAALILLYNAAFQMLSRELEKELDWRTDYVQRFTYWQVGLDYAAMFLLIHFTGGAASPFIFFFIFHIIFASILLKPRSAYGFAALAAVGMVIISVAEYAGWLSYHGIVFRGSALRLNERPFHILANLGFFTMSVFITAFSTTAIMAMLRKRIVSLAELSETLTMLNNKLNSLYVVTQAILSSQHLDQTLNIVTTELARVMNVVGVSVKLLSEDGKQLRYAAAHGLPEQLIKEKVVDIAKSPLNRRIIEGESYITGHVTQREMFQFGEDLAAAHIQSVLFVPLKVEDKVNGILGAYCKLPDRFKDDEVNFFLLAAGLVAIAIENTRAYESIGQLMQDRSWFMMRVAHNLRAPLAAIISILDVVRSGYQGALNTEQDEYLRRVDRRAHTMLEIINELMTLATERTDKRRVSRGPVDITLLTRRIRRTFQDEATKKGVGFQVCLPDGIPNIWGDFEMVEQMLENLVSNAIKYTPSGGNVSVVFSRGNNGTVRIEISDNGIGIPKTALPNLFTEFFRAENARAIEEHGTGLGLAIVKEIVDQHGGRILVESEEGLGTIFVVHLPVAHKEEPS
ncbi:MAG: sensor histidine kinase [Candidatus Abyssobacteria bacterium SURF_17]|uniref:histidine kinase n=1 Tax=Candidatus Abyssobacteria bacterium SURF_17 TaxID=2093361 RepID=A0A419ESG2_9BACT|nr:MAG: sensor histidine kinase [Candidatus Abyssubacteria bacterium SURF_17]